MIMERDDDEKILRFLKEYDELHFCLLVILYYHRYVNKTPDFDQVIGKSPKNILNNLPAGIIKLLQKYGFENKVSMIDEDRLSALLKEKSDYLTGNIKSVFSLWKILFYQFADLVPADYELTEEVFSELNIISLGELKDLMYVGENFSENTLTELLFILVQIANYKEIHIINYDEGSIDVRKCLENVEDELLVADQDILESMMNRITVVENAGLNFEYLNTYIERNADDEFLIVIGMERFVEFNNNSEINFRLMKDGFSLNTSENVNWSLLLDKINDMYALLREKTTYLVAVYRIDNLLDDARQKMQLYYRDSLFFGVVYDYSVLGSCESDKESVLYGELLNLILVDPNAYNRILEHEGELSAGNFIFLKASYFLNQNDFFHAIRELEQLPDDADSYFRFLLAELYNITGETRKAYVILTDIYEKDKYVPNLVNSIIYSLRYSDDKDEQLFWIRKGLEINPKDPVMVEYLANYYTLNEDYEESAEQWEFLYGLTGVPFYRILSGLNNILMDADKEHMGSIKAWVDETVTMYPRYADEIYRRIGSIIFDKINKEGALPYFEKVNESFDENYCIAAKRKLEIYYKKYSRGIGGKVNRREIESFVQALTKHVLILTFSAQSVYSWSNYIHKIYSYDKWVETANGILVGRLLALVKSYIRGEVKETRLTFNEKNVDDPARYFEDYKGMKTPNLEVMNTDEYLLFLLIQGKTKIEQGEIQLANDIAYTLFRLAGTYDDDLHRNISMCFGLLIWSGAGMAIGAYAEGILSFVAAADRLTEIGESIFLHDGEFVFDLVLYLYNSSFRAEISSSDCGLLAKYFVQFGYPKALLYHILGKHEDIIKMENPKFSDLIRQMEEANIVLMTKNKSLTDIIFIDSLISAYYEIGEPDKAGLYLRRMYPSIAATLKEHPNAAYHFFMRYSAAFMDSKEYGFAIDALMSLLLIIEKLRGVSFGSERSYLGDAADTIIRKAVCVICEKNCLDGVVTGPDEMLEGLLIYLLPRTIIEERNRNYETETDELLLRKEQEYYQLYELMNSAKEKSFGNVFYRQIVDRFLETKSYLEENHPRFRPLQQYSLIGYVDGSPFEFLEGKLKEGELFYRNILAEDTLIHVLVSKDSYHIYSGKIDPAELKRLLERLEDMIDDRVDNLKGADYDTYIDLFENITHMLYQPLADRMESFDSLYYMPDYKLLHVTPNFMRANDKWGIECFDRIELVIDYNNIGNSAKDSNNCPDKYFISGSTSGGLQEIKKTIDKFPSFTGVEPDETGRIVIRDPLNILTVAAHGVSEEFGVSYDGATKLQLSRKKQINLNEFIEVRAAVENAMIIACSGGTPANDKIERNNGVWDSMIKKGVKYILYCKWDVSTEHTNSLLDIMLREMCLNKRPLSEALNTAQRELKNLNPILWAGLEVWKNYS